MWLGFNNRACRLRVWLSTYSKFLFEQTSVFSEGVHVSLQKSGEKRFLISQKIRDIPNHFLSQSYQVTTSFLNIHYESLSFILLLFHF